MTVGKAAALTAAFVGVFAVGVAVGLSGRDRLPAGNPMAAPAVGTAESTAPAPAPSPAPAKSPQAGATTAARKAAAPPSAVTSNTARDAAIPLSEPRLQARLKQVLNRGAHLDVAAKGFRSAEEFAAVAHAARNINVPFMVLKHRVVDEGRTLADAIHEAKPQIDAKAEAERAEAAAKSDIAAIAN